MADQHGPDAKVKGYVDVRHKQGTPTRIEFTVEHLVDTAPWHQTDFVFDISDGVASVRSISPEADTFYINQNRKAREKAYDVVEELPSVSEVERLYD